MSDMEDQNQNRTARSCGSDASACSRSYFPGMDCQCGARSELECGCIGVDWTPSEVVRLRKVIEEMEIRHAAVMLHTQTVVDAANAMRAALEAADECLALIEDVGHGAHMDNVTVARRIVCKALYPENVKHIRPDSTP